MSVPILFLQPCASGVEKSFGLSWNRTGVTCVSISTAYHWETLWINFSRTIWIKPSFRKGEKQKRYLFAIKHLPLPKNGVRCIWELFCSINLPVDKLDQLLSLFKLSSEHSFQLPQQHRNFSERKFLRKISETPRIGQCQSWVAVLVLDNRLLLFL